MIDAAHEHAKALNVASFGDMGPVIDPAQPRQRLIGSLAMLAGPR